MRSRSRVGARLIRLMKELPSTMPARKVNWLDELPSKVANVQDKIINSCLEYLH